MDPFQFLNNIFGNLFKNIDGFLGNIFGGGLLGGARRRGVGAARPKQDLSMPTMNSVFSRISETKSVAPMGTSISPRPRARSTSGGT